MVLAPNFWSLIDFLHAFLSEVDFNLKLLLFINYKRFDELKAAAAQQQNDVTSKHVVLRGENDFIHLTSFDVT